MKRLAFNLSLAALVTFTVAIVCHHWVDIPVYRALTITDPASSAKWEPITRAGLSGWYLAALPVLFILFRFALRRRVAANRCLFILLTVLSSGLIITALKPLLGRARPSLLLEGIYGYKPFTFGWHYSSMPSGHSTTVAALAACLWVLFPRLRWLWVAIGAVIASSRLAMGVHFLSDVLIGASIAVASMILTRRAFERFRIPLSPAVVDVPASGP